ncbi:hypothetical protein DACRYDRAFT_106598 [Dacryopinax primogenitus]|uniref:Uncharacterized protein n=1 Tax=Dacryopinax primogenitus (strain DJM 731) TaxID=1858805 RepID=M5G9I7_DACPD|nr:uncharacterized protein DACRYDRAFT_106598 [Dacryopinax primogenitus]EJU02527.1 hypothetical protein DACRYDRAFT_106598 [Dacryopinax primogenitus]
MVIPIGYSTIQERGLEAVTADKVVLGREVFDRESDSGFERRWVDDDDDDTTALMARQVIKKISKGSTITFRSDPATGISRNGVTTAKSEGASELHKRVWVRLGDGELQGVRRKDITGVVEGPKRDKSSRKCDWFCVVIGTIGCDKEFKIPDGVQGQTKLLLDNIIKVLAAAGSSLDQVLKVNVYLI